MLSTVNLHLYITGVASAVLPLASLYLSALTFETTFVKHVFNSDALSTWYGATVQAQQPWLEKG